MKTRLTLTVVSVLLGSSVLVAQGAGAPPAVGAGRGAGQAAPPADPKIVTPGPTPGLTAPNAPRLPYHFVTPPAVPAGQRYGSVAAVALTPQGHLLVLNRNPSFMMVEFDAQGRFLRTFNPNIALNAHGMRVDREGNIWVLDHFLNVVWKLKPNGEPIMTIGTRGEVGKWDDTKWNGMFNQPVDIAFDKDDNFYVVQGHGGTAPPAACTYCATYVTARPPVTQGSDPRVFKFDKTGRYISSRALPHADGTYPTIHTVVYTAKGEIWVTDRGLRKILVMDTDLRPLREIQHSVLTSGLFVDAKGAIWMTAGVDGMIMSLDPDGKVTGWAGQVGPSSDVASNPNAIGEAHYLVVSPDQRTIFIADSANARVHKLERD
jgi:hypothetical protein